MRAKPKKVRTAPATKEGGKWNIGARAKDPAFRAQLTAAKAAARAARGGVSWNALTTLVVAQEMARRGIPITGGALGAVVGETSSCVNARLTVLKNAGYLSHPDRYIWMVERSVDINDLRPKSRREVYLAIANLPKDDKAPLTPGPTSSPAASDTKLLRAALRALAPFARYGARSIAMAPDGVPMLLRRDGLTYAAFMAAHEARVGLLAALGDDGAETAETPPAKPEVDGDEQASPAPEGFGRYV